MRIIQFLSEPFWQQLGLTLVHFLWQGVAVAVLVAAIVRLFRLGPGHLRYSAYLIGFALIAVCPLVTLITINRLAETEMALPEASVASSAPAGIDVAESPPAGDAVVRPGVPVKTAGADAAPASAGSGLEVWLPWAVAFWMAGVTLLSARLLLGFVGIWRWRRDLRPLPEALAGRVGQLSEKLGMPQFSRVFLSPAVVQATAVGYLRPMVLLPAAMLTGMDPAMIEAVVAHELAHIRRLDLWVNLAQRIVETLLFYHPAVWWLSRRLRAEREFCCDEAAVAATGERLTYATALETAQRGRLAAGQPALAVALGQGRRSTLSRVRHILGLPPVPSDSRSWLAGAIVVVFLALLAMPVASLLTAQARTKTIETDETLAFKLIDAAVNGELEEVKTLIAAGADVNGQDADDRAALHYAAEAGHVAVVRLLVGHGADVNGGTEAGWTPLLAAASAGHEQVAALLLEHGAPVDAPDADGCTPLVYAIWADDEETVKTLLAHGADVNRIRPGDYSPLVYAVWQWHTGNVKVLIEAGADVNAKDGDGWTPLYWAVDEGAAAVIALFLKAGVEVSDIQRAVLEGDLARVKRLVETGTDVDTRDGIGRPLSHWALSAGQMEVFDHLLKEGADVALAGNQGLTLLHIASRKGLADVVKRLIGKGAAVDAGGDGGKTPLFLAARLGHQEVCRLLIASGADVNAALKNGRHPLGDATVRGHEGVVRLLIANGADVNLSVNNRGTALHAAANYGRPALVDVLIAAGADVNADSRLGTPLHQALRYRSGVDEETVVQTVQKLLGYGADVGARHKQLGHTPLHVAAQRGRTEAARLLIAAGADVNAKDKEGRTPLSYAEGLYPTREVAELLRKHGADDKDTAAQAHEAAAEALHRAAAAGDVDGIKELIAEGADVNAGYGDDHWTPLLAAADGGHEQVVKILLDNGADPDQSQGGSYAFTPLHRAIFSDDAQVVEMLIQAGADVNKRPNSQDDPPLFYAVWQCHDAVKPLIDAGADVNVKGVGNEWTPLRHALQWGHGDIARQFTGSRVEISPEQIAVLEGDVARVRQLIEGGTDVDSKDEFGWTLTYWALSAGQKDVAEYLLRQGADISARTSDGFTLLHQASQAGFADVVKALLTKGADVNATGLEGRHPLGTAASSGHLEVVRLLLANGADVNATWMNGRHALGDAASNGHRGVVELLIAHGAEVNLHAGGRGGALHAAAQTGHALIVDLLIANGADVNLSGQRGMPLHRAVGCKWNVDEDTCGHIVGKLIAAGAEVDAREPRQGGTPLHIAAQKGRVQAARRLINGGADGNAKDNNGKTPLALAQEQGRAEIVELLRKHGAKDTDSRPDADEAAGEALYQAAAAGDVEKVKELIAQGADVNAEGAIGWTPLLGAVNEGHVEAVKVLLDNGANVDVGDGWYTPLYYPIWDDNIDVEMVRTLISGGADLDPRPKEGDFRPLVYAVWYRRPDIAKILIEAGADVNAETEGGATPLHHAVQKAHPEMARQFVGTGVKIPALHNAILEGDLAKVKQLIESGADVDMAGKLGWTPLYWAVSAGQQEVAEYLLSQGADVNAKIQAGLPLLHQASRAGLTEIVKALTAKGAKVDVKCEGGTTPLQQAAGTGQEAVVRLLVANGAEVNVTAKDGTHPLGDAAANGHEAVVRLLLASGAEVDLQPEDKMVRGTALHAAAFGGHSTIIDILIANGADVNAVCKNGVPLHLAASPLGSNTRAMDNRGARVVEKLLAHGADVDARHPGKGSTPLYGAVARGRYRTAEVLIAAGADVRATDNEGKTLLSLAREAGRTRIAELLGQHGAK